MCADLSLLKSLVQTDMGNTGAKLFGMKEAPVPTKDSVAGVVAQVCLRINIAKPLGTNIPDQRDADGALD